jgi:ComF family protein
VIDRALRHCRLLFDIALPVRCAACGMHGRELCDSCLHELSGAPLLRRPARGEVPSVTALGPHGGPLRTAVLNVKFRNRTHAAFVLGTILGEKLACRDEILVAVPLHERRHRERGFNQAEAIARGIAHTSGAVLCTHALLRTRATDPQRALPLSRRGPNVWDAFALAAAASRVRGRRIVLVDDVVTTGATIAACARVLLHAGAARVRAAAIAIKV